MASCQSTDANATATSFTNTPLTGDGPCGLAENTTIFISTPLAAVSLDPLSNDSAGIVLCPIDDWFPASADTKRPGDADCKVSADIRYWAGSPAWAFGVGTNVIALNANSLALALSPGINPFVGEGELACTASQFLSDLATGGRSTSAVLGRQEQRAR